MDGLVMNWRSAVMMAVLLPVLICGVILLFRRVEAPASRALGAALIISALAMGPQVIGFANAYQIWPWLTFFPLFYGDLWIGPLLYLHAHMLMRGTDLGWRKWLLLPGLVQFLYYSGAFILPGLFDHQAKWAFNNAVHEPFVVPIESTLGIGLMLFAIVAIWRMRKTYLEFLDTTQSAVRAYDPIWLRNLIIALIVAAIIYAGLEITPLTYVGDFPFQLLLMGVIAWLGLDAAWRLTAEFPKHSATEPPASEAPDPDPSLAERILTQMTTQKWYLEPRLSIRDVAIRLGTNETYVSRAMNGRLGQSFNRIVNGLRVDHAKRQMVETSHSILSIALDSGFNSKATFNRVFREITGQTPSQFRTSQNP